MFAWLRVIVLESIAAMSLVWSCLQLAMAPVGPWTHDCVAVDAPEIRFGPSFTDEFGGRGQGADVVYVLREGRLFLCRQSTRPLLLATQVKSRRWDVAAITALRRDHPELEPLWPDPGAADGGVRWLHR